MTNIIQQLRAGDMPPPDEIASYIENLEERIRSQHATMDKAASIMLEATVSDDGIDSEQADACIDQIRGMFAEVGKTTVEHYQGLIYAKVAEIAGLAPDDEFDIMAELEKLGTAAAFGKKHLAYANWAMSVLWNEREAPARSYMTTDTGCGCCANTAFFPVGTTWAQALDAILAKEASAEAAMAAE